MKIKPALFAFFASTLLLQTFHISGLANSKTPLKDPYIPDGETAVYRIEEGDQAWQYTEVVRVEKNDGNDIYNITSTATTEITEVKIQKRPMIPFSVFKKNIRDTMTVETSTHVTMRTDIQSEDIVLLTLTDLRYSLRGYPFGEEAPELGVIFLNADDEEDDGPAFEIKISYVEVDEIVVQGRKIPCHKLELKARAFGIMRIMNGFIGKTYFWYSVESPHYLVAYEGNSSFPGSPKVEIKIEDYSGWR